jgi:N-acylneuraminate cytidylyltransferase
MNVAIIPARGGSKRIPRKNVRQFCGRPIIAWPIAAAAASGLFDRILVSTDDSEIAGVAREAGAEVPFFRPNDLADDQSGTTDVIVHALSWCAEAGWEVDAACCIYATAAFASAEDLAAARRLLSSECDYAFAAVRYGHPPQRGFLRGDDGSPELLRPEHQETRTQDLPPVFHDAGQFYWGTRAAWTGRRPFFSDRTRFIELPAWRAQDIDREEDWALAEHLFEAMRARGG